MRLGLRPAPGAEQGIDGDRVEMWAEPSFEAVRSGRVDATGRRVHGVVEAIGDDELIREVRQRQDLDVDEALLLADPARRLQLGDPRLRFAERHEVRSHDGPGPALRRGRTRGDRAGDRLLADLPGLPVVAGTHQPTGQTHEDVRALGRRRLLGHQPDGFPVLGEGLLVAVLGPQAVADPGVEVTGQGRLFGRIDTLEGVADPGDRLLAVTGIVGDPRRSPAQLDRIRQVRRSALVCRQPRLEADREAVLATGGGEGVDRRGRLGRRDAGTERLARPVGGEPVVGQLRGCPGRARVGELRSLGEHDGESFVDAPSLGRQQVLFEHLAEQRVTRAERASGRDRGRAGPP